MQALPLAPRSAPAQCTMPRCPVAFLRSPLCKFVGPVRAGLHFQDHGLRLQRDPAVPGAARDLYNGRSCAHHQPAAQQHDHLPLLAVHMRTHVAVRLERNQQALNLILMVGVQQDVRAPSRARGRRVCELRQLRLRNVLRSFGVGHDGTISCLPGDDNRSQSGSFELRQRARRFQTRKPLVRADDRSAALRATTRLQHAPIKLNGALSIAHNQIPSFSALGAVGVRLAVAGFGPISGAGRSDMVLRNVNTGAFAVYDVE